LLIKLSSLGDVVHCFPILRAIKKHNPESHISWLIDDRFLELAQCSSAVDDLFLFYRDRWARPTRLFQTIGDCLDLRKKMKESKFDVAIDLQGLLRSGMVGWFSGARRRIGFPNGREGSRFFYNTSLPVPEGDVHAIDRYLSVLEHLEIPYDGTVDYGIELPQEAQEKVDLAWPKNNEKELWVTINPNARWSSKRWPEEKFARLAYEVIERTGSRVFFIGTGKDRMRVARIRMKTEKLTGDLTGRLSIPELFAFLGRTDLLITNDSGPMHMAAAIGTPVVAIFGPTNPSRTGPYSENHRIVRKDIECSPCYFRKCPIGHNCMKELEPEEVLEQVVDFLTVQQKRVISTDV